MRILIVSQYFWPENFRINDLALGMRQRGHQVTVLTGTPNYPSGHFYTGYGLFKKTTEMWQGVRVFRSPLISRGKGGGGRLALNYFSFAILASIWGAFRLGRNFDVILVHEPSPITVGIPAIVMKKITGAPILFWVLDLWPESVAAAGSIKQAWVFKALASLTKWIYSHCSYVLVQSQGFIGHTKGMGVPEERIRYFPSWAEALYRPIRAELGAVPDLPSGTRIMFAGNIGVSQDFATILDAAELLKERLEIHWVIIGDGRMLPWVRNEVARRGLEQTVHLLGRHPVEKMPAFFAQADALLVSLKREPIFSSTIPGKIQSYLACARPIIAMLDGEGARIVSDAGAGLTCPAEDAQALADAVLIISRKNKDELVAMGNNGRKYYETHFDREVLFPQLEGWMHELTIKGK